MAYVLIGYMGAGKSTAARELGAALGTVAQDSDAILAERLGEPVAAAFASRGEAAFRAQEEDVVCALLDHAGAREVIALGGGSVLSSAVRERLREHVCVLLEVAPETAWQRTGAGLDGARPLARERGAFLARYEDRRALYEDLADAILPEMALGEMHTALGALETLAAAPPGTTLLLGVSAAGRYPVLVGSGLLGAPALAGAMWPLARERSRPFCVSDEHVAPLYGGALRELAELIVIPAGEERKTLAVAELVWRGLIEGGMTRADHIVALGGGVVGDLAGFCAATYQRGVPVVQVPTTLVAQVDSAYGGKTGIDLPEAKNYVGAYHQPAGVLVDPEVLSSLPSADLNAGWVEVLKTALIAGGELWERVGGGAAIDEWTVLRCARTKLAVVAEDERDADRRQVLNLGHTVGHAIETATGYSRYRHGEAVGLGLLAALRLSGQAELREQVRELLLANSLPVEASGASAEDVISAIGRDKKRLEGKVPFVLVNAPGEVVVGREVGDGDLLDAVAEILA